MMLLICMTICILFTVSCAFASDVANETISTNDLEVQELQINSNDENNTNLKASESLSTSTVYFDASASKDGTGTQSNPYKYYKSNRIDYGSTAYFADGEYVINESTSIYSSSAYKTTFIGQSVDKTILKFTLPNKFALTVTDNSYLVLNKLTMVNVHINNHANLIANNVEFKNSAGFNQNNAPGLSYSYISKIYDASYGGVIICDTPSNKQTTLNLTNCNFKNNKAVSGGVIATYNTIANIQNCQFYDSTATRFGGVFYTIKSTFNIRDSSFNLNHANYGGAIYANSSNFNIKYSDFSLSQAYSFGGVIASFSSNLDFNHVTFKDYASLNDAGGALYAIGGKLTVADSTFQNGSADFGGAICNLKCDSTIKNSQFTDNEATYYGGSIYNMYGNMELTGNNFKNTKAKIGGSIFNRMSKSFKLSNNRFTTSTAKEDGPIVFIDGANVKVVQSGNTYDSSNVFLKYGNVYDIDHYESVPLINYSAELPETMPSSYDGRKYGYVTPAKDQIQGGNCWAFSGIATLEACLKKATGIEYDFSEENVKNLMSEYSLFDLDTGANSGGNLYMFIAYLAGWFGPTYDINDIYDDYSALSVIYDSIMHVQNIYILPERQNFYDNDNIKKAVLQYGAVSIGIDLSQNQGHAVTIVGWDDEFVSNDFLGNKAVGAWIIKNSWGSKWGSEGFGYLSYLQPISYGYTFILNDDRKYSNIYQYDYAGKSGYHTVNGNTVHIKNKFTAKNDEILSAVSTYFDEVANYTVSVYLNGNLVTTQSGVHEKGYYTIPLTKEISLKKGNTFEIAIKFSNGGSKVYMPICDNGINRIENYNGISFFCTDGKSWNDLYKSYSGVACIKAFTRSEKLTDVSIKVDSSASSSLSSVNVGDLINIQLNLPKDYTAGNDSHSLGGLVTFTINDQEYFATVENGKACLNFTFDKEGKYNVKVQLKSSRAVSNLIEFPVNVVKTAQADLVIQANDVSKFYGSPQNYVATLYNANKALTGVNVKILLNGKEYTTKKTDSKGQIVLDFKELPVGVYDVSAQYGGKTVSSKFTILTTIIANDAVQDFSESYISASFVDTDGEMLQNNKISYSVTLYGVKSKPIEFTATTDKLGVATAKIILYSDKYLVSVVNPASGEKKEFTLDVSQIDSKTSVSVSQSGNTVIIDATLDSGYSTGYVNFLVLGKVYKANVQRVEIDGGTVALARLGLSNLAVGDYSVSAIYSGDDNFKVSSDTREFSVTKNPNTLISHNYGSYYGRSGTVASVINSTGQPVKGEVVSATILGKTYTSTTDEKGNATFKFELGPGNYTVLFRYNGQSLFKRVTIYSTIDDVTSSTEYLNSKLGAYFIDPKSDLPNPNTKYGIKFVVDGQVKFIVDGKEYKSTTGSNGYASANVDLPVGTQTVTIVNSVSGEKKQSKVTVFKTTPKVLLTKSKHGDLIIFTAKLTQTSAIGNVVFTMGDKKYTSQVVDGEAILALRNLDEGSYDIYANYIGDSNFNNIISNTLKFDYRHTNYSVSYSKLSKYYSGSEKFTVTLTNFNKPAANDVILITLNNKVYKLKTASNGVASLNVDLNPGNYRIEGYVVEDEDVKVFSDIEVKSTINVNSGAVSDSKMSVEFRDGNGVIIKNKDASFKIGSTEYKQTTDVYGVATLEPSLDKGNYNVTIINPVTRETKYSTLTISRSTPTISVSQVTQDGVDVLKVVLPKTATGEVTFVLDNGEEYTSEINNGVSILEVSILEGLDPGQYKVVVKYAGDKKLFNPVSKSAVFKVSQVKGVISASDVKTTYGTSKYIVITLKDSMGNILYGRTVTVNLNNAIYSGVVQGDGVAKIKISSKLAVKSYEATITYGGESGILPDTFKIKVTVNKATPKLTAAKKTFKVKDKTKKYVVTLKTDKKKVYKSQKITIKVKGKTYTAKTNKKGQAIFKLNKLTKKGAFTATVKFAGNSKYKAITKKVKFTVK